MALDQEPRSVAVVRLRTGLGDLLCGVPALRALRAHLPRAHIALVTFPEMAPVVERQSAYVDELLAFPGYPGIPERPPRPHELPAFFAAARARRFDLAIQAYGKRAAATVVTERLGARRTAGFLTAAAPGADPATHIAYPEHEHEVRRHLRLLAHLGVPAGDEALEFPIDAEDGADAAAVRAHAGLDGGPYVLLHPGATSPSRRWPAERFAAVGDALAARGLRVAITGVRGEEPLTGRVAAAMRADAADLCGRTRLGTFAALMRDARGVVANDTGATHLAAAVRTPSVAVFLSGDPRRFGHAGRGPHRVLRVPVECSPCPHLSCPIDHRCAQRLPERLVISHALAMAAMDRR